MSFDLERSGFNVVVTRPGEIPPHLGQMIPIDYVTRDHMRTKMPILWNTDDTYTFSCFNMHADFTKWAFVELPVGLKDRGMEQIIGPQHINMRLYATTTNHPKKHNQSELETLLDLELSHTHKSRMGPHATKWKSFKKQVVDRNKATTSTPVPGKEKLGRQQQYVRSGQQLSLAVGSKAGSLGNKSGFAVVQNDSLSLVVIEKVVSTILPDDEKLLLCTGNLVFIKLLLAVQRSKTKKQRDRHHQHCILYLTTHRGGRRLKWVKKVPRKNGIFVLVVADSSVDDDGERNKQHHHGHEPLRKGSTFQLQHSRWPEYFVSQKAVDRPYLVLGKPNKHHEALNIHIRG